MDGDKIVDDPWDRIRGRLTSTNVELTREVRRLIHLPQSEAVRAIADAIASDDVPRLHKLFTLLANVSSNLLKTDRSGGAFARQQTATLLANKLGDRIKELGHPTKTLSPSETAKQDAYVKLTGRLISHADWNDESEAAARKIINELEALQAENPPGFLCEDEAIAIAWDGVGTHLDGARLVEPAMKAYRRAVIAFEAAKQKVEARKMWLKMVVMIRRLSVNFDETIEQISEMLGEIEADEPSLERAKMHLELGETFSAVGDRKAALKEIESAENESWRCGWWPPDLDDIEGSFSKWVAQAELIGTTADEFATAIFDEISLESAALALRSKVALDVAERNACSVALQHVIDLEKRLTDTALAATNANRAEAAGFMTEFGGEEIKQDWLALPTNTKLGRLIELHDSLDRAVDTIRADFSAGAPASVLLPRIDPIVAEAQAHGLSAVEAAALLLRSDILVEAGSFEAARTAGREAFDIPRDPLRDLTTGLYSLDRMITASIALKDPAALSAICNDAISLIERHRYNINAPYAQSAFLQDRSRYYTMGMDTAFRCDDWESLIQRAELFKAAGTVHNFGSSAVSVGELADQFRKLTVEVEQARQTGNNRDLDRLAEKRRRVWDRLAIERARERHHAESTPLTLAALHAALELDQAVISWYWLTRDVLMIIVFDNRRIRATKVKIEEADRAAINEFAESVQSLRGSSGLIDEVDRFANALLPKAIDPILEGKRRVILSPHRVLHALPLHVLPWNGEVLIRHFAISYVPNLSCLIRRYSIPQPRSALAVGIKDFVVPGETLKALPECLTEVDAIAAIWSENGISRTELRDGEATASAIRTLASDGALEKLTCLHFATHGADVRGDNPMEAHLWLHDSRLDGLEIAMWQLRADLVVLSACHSGQRAVERDGAELMGDDIFGLQAALFAAGAARVLGALWPADSPTAAALMTEFHRRYAAGDPPELALQAAMLNRLDNATPLTEAAYYWAPFYIAAVAQSVANNHS